MAIICIKAGSGAHPLRKGLVQGVRLHDGSSDLSNAITVRVVYERVDTGMPLSGDRQREQAFDVAAARPPALPWHPAPCTHRVLRSRSNRPLTFMGEGK